MAYSPIFPQSYKNNQQKHWLFCTHRPKIDLFKEIASEFTGYFLSSRQFLQNNQ